MLGLPPTIEAASLGVGDSLFLMLLALMVFGPRRLPEIGRQVGKLMYEFRKASNDFKFQMEEELRAAEEADRQRKLEADRLRMATITAPELPTPALAEPVPSLGLGMGLGPESDASADYPATGSADEPATEPGPRVESPSILPPTIGNTVARNGAALDSHPAAIEPAGEAATPHG